MKKNLLIPLVTVTATLGAFAATAAARSTPALLGRPVNGSHYTCLNSNPATGAIRNDCSATVEWVLGLPLDSNGGHSGTVTVNVPDRLATVCRVIGIGRDGTGISVSPFANAPAAQTPANIPYSGVNVPSNGLMYVQCLLGPSAQVIKNDHLPN